MILEIEKLVFEGVGLSHNENGIAVFVKGAMPGDIVEIEPYKNNKHYILAKVKEIKTPSKYRIKPVCPLSKPCGGCDLAFIEYDFQLKLKEQIVKEIFKNTEILPVIKSPKIINHRAKTQYACGETKISKRPLLGYYMENTHEIVNIKYCPAQPEIIDKIVDFIRNNWGFGCYCENTRNGLLRRINTRISNSNGDILLEFVLNADKISEKEKHFISTLTVKFPQIKGVFVNFNTNITNKITGDRTILVEGKDYIIENLSGFKYKIGINSFFQVNPNCAVELFNAAKKLIKSKGNFLDLYGGSGAIGIFMKDVVSKITLVEQNSESVSFARENFKLNNIEKYEIFEGNAKKTINSFIKEKKWFDNAVIDPPRKGSDRETLSSLSKMTNSIIYISCNPMTLYRDSSVLIENGFELKSVQPVDMFPNTHHIELVADFKRSKR
ncbi:MAG: 23S rRNA (uracil(1939)-C(5))-methyltransferase RlmD [Candidatus Gastranaerophilales bacterium]|nr:23S rRNA (uracil(1939)-C(5))-methyltransferase RlmD [Candidatus Gastranaerophilales bacterium]